MASDIAGTVLFEPIMDGSQVYATFYGLPAYQPASNGNDPIGPLPFIFMSMQTVMLGISGRLFKQQEVTGILQMNRMVIMQEIFQLFFLMMGMDIFLFILISSGQKM